MMIFSRVAARSISMCETPPPANFLLQIPLEPEVLGQELIKVLLGEPMRVPVLVVSDPESVWMNFLSHY
jgi:hypothetical protein